ncbi:hypothetical protein BRADI_2g35017v3 [Brachypodium distachyon]|uniref:Reverse transcriptase zinc-binding domain-containing protein n=1 Tax=Brachypodium distachyon TaxID=15368 RepID=A0A2K2DBV7_BRADI|nr:hypothetical protein BRADI_2g35017v3 [Brachypodium distachyon]
MQPETRDHLFFHCPFAKTCWQYLCPSYDPQPNVHANINQLKQKLKVPFHMQLTISSLYSCRQIFKKEFNLVFHRAKRKNYAALATWLQNFR